MDVSVGGAQTLALELEHLHFPTLGLANAAIGQPVPSFRVVRDLLDSSALHQIARDRTMRWDAATLTWSLSAGKQTQVIVDGTVSRSTASPASAGVVGFSGSGTEIYPGAQWISTGLLGRDAVTSVAVRLADVDKARIATFEATQSARLPAGFRISACLQLANRDNKAETGHQTMA